MLEIAVSEEKDTLGELLDRVESGEEILFTRHGKAIARLVPSLHPDPVDRAAIAAAAKRIREAASEAKLKFNWEEFKQDRDSGCR